MQAEDMYGANANLGQLLGQLAAEADPGRSLKTILAALRQVTSADGVSLTRLADLHLHLVEGERSLWFHDMALYARLLDTMPTPWAHQIALGEEVAAKTWYTARLHDASWVVCVWFKDATARVDMREIEDMLHLLTLVCGTYMSHHRQKRANQLSDSVINSILDPLLVLTEDRRLVLMNEAAERVFGVRSANAVDQPLASIVKSEDLLALLDVGDSDRSTEWITGEEGNQQTFVPLLSVVHTPDGVPDGRVLALRDVSRFKRLNQNQREFMRIVSHDLRSPLTAIQGFADMVRMGMVGDLTEKQEYFIDKILSGITQMTSIVENIQDAGRFDPETGFYEMERTHVDLGGVAAKIVKGHIIPAEKDNLKLNLNVADDVPIVNVDENMLTRAMTNLVDNAIKYTPDGGNVVIDIHRDRDHVVVAVADDGDGISEEDQKRLFRRHVRLARKEHVRVKGTGLGLFIVRSVAQAHGGDALVHSVAGEGTTFSIIIPLTGSNLIGGAT